MRNYLEEARQNYEESRKAGEKKGVFSVCPGTYKQPCKMCDLAKAILFHKDRYNEEQIQQARDLNRKKKFYSNIYLTSNPSEVVVFEYGPLIGDKLSGFEMAPDSDLKGFTDPHNGRNLRVTKIPNANPKLTKYDVEPRMASGAIPDMRILNKMYDLDNIIELIRDGQVKPLYQSKLPDGTTEIRILPSWLGPKFSSVFQLHYFLHYGINEEDLASIQRWELNPLEDILREKTIVVPQPQREVQKPQSPAEQWAVEPPRNELPSATWNVANVAPTEQTKGRPVCFGTFDEDEPDCIVVCKRDTLQAYENCRAETEAKLSKRVRAKGLYR